MFVCWSVKSRLALAKHPHRAEDRRGGGNGHAYRGGKVLRGAPVTHQRRHRPALPRAPTLIPDRPRRPARVVRGAVNRSKGSPQQDRNLSLLVASSRRYMAAAWQPTAFAPPRKTASRRLARCSGSSLCGTKGTPAANSASRSTNARRTCWTSSSMPPMADANFRAASNSTGKGLSTPSTGASTRCAGEDPCPPLIAADHLGCSASLGVLGPVPPGIATTNPSPAGMPATRRAGWPRRWAVSRHARARYRVGGSKAETWFWPRKDAGEKGERRSSLPSVADSCRLRRQSKICRLGRRLSRLRPCYATVQSSVTGTT